MAIRGRICLRMSRFTTGQFKCRLSLPPPDPISAGDEVLERHTEPAVDQELSIFLRHDDVILLAQVTDDVLDQRRLARGSIGMYRFSGEQIAALGNFASTAHPDALYLFGGYAELGRKLRVLGIFCKPVQELVSPFCWESQAGRLLRCRLLNSTELAGDFGDEWFGWFTTRRRQRRCIDPNIIRSVLQGRTCYERFGGTRQLDRPIEWQRAERVVEQPEPPGGRVVHQAV